MKKLVLCCGALLVGFVIVVISAVSLGQDRVVTKARAQEAVMLDRQASESGVLEDVVIETQTDYYLPYPGILPDHPLYSVKMLRDKLRLFLASGAQKNELRLLYANKRIGAAKALVDGGKQELGISTAMKAEGYLNQLVGQDFDQLSDEFLSDVFLASKKHREILSSISKQIDEGLITRLETVEKANSATVDKLNERFGESVVEESVGEEVMVEEGDEEGYL